jgi:hypothetical protein
MNDPIAVYFAGEKHGALWCFGLGVAAAAFAVWVWRTQPQFRMMTIPVGLVALIQLGIGVGLYARTDKQVAHLRADLAEDHAVARSKELNRMERVNASFTMVEIVEAILIVAGLAMALAFRARPMVTAIGLGLLLQASVMLAFDSFAEHRAHVYTEWLRGGS